MNLLGWVLGEHVGVNLLALKDAVASLVQANTNHICGPNRPCFCSLPWWTIMLGCVLKLGALKCIYWFPRTTETFQLWDFPDPCCQSGEPPGIEYFNSYFVEELPYQLVKIWFSWPNFVHQMAYSLGKGNISCHLMPRKWFQDCATLRCKQNRQAEAGLGAAGSILFRNGLSENIPQIVWLLVSAKQGA